MSEEATTQEPERRLIAMKPTAYYVFKYHELLRNPKATARNFLSVKFNLINMLVGSHWGKMSGYSMEERQNFVDSVAYRKKLREEIKKLKKSN